MATAPSSLFGRRDESLSPLLIYSDSISEPDPGAQLSTTLTLAPRTAVISEMVFLLPAPLQSSLETAFRCCLGKKVIPVIPTTNSRGFPCVLDESHQQPHIPLCSLPVPQTSHSPTALSPTALSLTATFPHFHTSHTIYLLFLKQRRPLPALDSPQWLVPPTRSSSRVSSTSLM